ncbi:MAG: hypothetical protein SWZ49_15620, partial [Cyanobacteriota bacterium]|nr:hypothetical protein [Cyanobacteriota bacterium]
PNIAKPEQRNKPIPIVIPINGMINCLFEKRGAEDSAPVFFHVFEINFKVPSKAAPEVTAIKNPIAKIKYGGSVG